jgi:hypothetical protein
MLSKFYGLGKYNDEANFLRGDSWYSQSIAAQFTTDQIIQARRELGLLSIR